METKLISRLKNYQENVTWMESLCKLLLLLLKYWGRGTRHSVPQSKYWGERGRVPQSHRDRRPCTFSDRGLTYVRTTHVGLHVFLQLSRIRKLATADKTRERPLSVM